jgi:hypothetical protein
MTIRGQYTIWGIADPENFRPSGKGAYINKIYDTIYFPDGQPEDFWLLDLLHEDHYPWAEHAYNHWEYDVPALQAYIDQLEGIHNIAMPWRNWPPLIYRYNSTWLWHFSSLKKLTVVLGTRKQHRCNRKPMRFIPINPESVQAESAQIIERRIQKGLDFFHQYYPGHPTPQFRIMAFLPYNNRDTSSSEFEARFRRALGWDGWDDEDWSHFSFGAYLPWFVQI